MAAQRLDLFQPSDEPLRPLAHCDEGVAWLPITVTSIPGHAEMTQDFHPTARIFVARSGEGRRWYQQGGKTRALKTAPGMIEVYERGLSFDHCRWEGTRGLCISVEFTETAVAALTHGELAAPRLATRHEVFDPRISGLTFEIAEQALAGLPAGRLYLQGLTLALLSAVCADYTAAGSKGDAQRVKGLDPRQSSQLLAHIRERIGTALSLDDMAGVVRMSPFHFSRVFKSTFGTTPHRFVLEQRLQVALCLLQRNRTMSIADIAAAVGFSSQAHMTALMRKRFGATPRIVREAAHAQH